jgi:hypothetical protein
MRESCRTNENCAYYKLKEHYRFVLYMQLCILLCSAYGVLLQNVASRNVNVTKRNCF